MSNTRHIQKTLSQKELALRMNALIDQYLPDYARQTRTLAPEDCLELARKLHAVRDQLDKVSRRGGLVLVCAGGSEITTYRVDSYRPGTSGRSAKP
jgi:hypothetical protein